MNQCESLRYSRGSLIITRKMSKYGVFSGPYFPLIGLNTSVFSPNMGKCGPENTPYLDTFYAVNKILRRNKLS